MLSINPKDRPKSGEVLQVMLHINIKKCILLQQIFYILFKKGIARIKKYLRCNECMVISFKLIKLKK